MSPQEENMIPDSVASAEPYVGLWGHLKSIDHALGRALSSSDLKKLTELDRDRLQALIDLLKASMPEDGGSSDAAEESLIRGWTTEPDYSTAMDFHERIANHPSFREWKRSSKKSFGEKVGQLTVALQSVLEHAESRDRTLIAKEPVPQEELEILRAVLRSILAETEAALY
jgi:hypothetical protein